MGWTEEYQDFEGTAAEMETALDAITAALPWAKGPPRPNVRLIRHYTQAGALDRPERRGKEAYYGFSHLVQFLALRALLIEGWPLRKAADEIGARSQDALFELIPADDAAPGRSAQLASMGGGAPANGDAVVARQRKLTERKNRLAAALPPLRAETPSENAQSFLRLDLTPWCHGLISAPRLKTLTDEEAETLGEALVQALIDARGEAKRRRH